jgi:hypothetical protein
VAAVGPHPTRIGRDSVGPETAQQFPPIDLGFRRAFKSSLETGGTLPACWATVAAWLTAISQSRTCSSMLGISSSASGASITWPMPPWLSGTDGVPLRLLVTCRIVRFRARILLRFTLVIGLWLRFGLAQVVDLLGAHAAKAWIDEHIVRQAETGIEQQRVDRIIAGLVPAPGVALGPPGVMLERGVHDLVGQHPGQRRRVQRIDERGL